MSTYLVMRACVSALELLSEHRSVIVPRMFLTELAEIEGQKPFWPPKNLPDSADCCTIDKGYHRSKERVYGLKGS